MALKVSWLSHACFLIEADQTKILMDPFITDNPLSPVKADTVDADFILVSHGHGDHVGDTIELPNAPEPPLSPIMKSRTGL